MTNPENQKFQIQKTEINYLKGVGPKRGAILKKNGLLSIRDILKYYPRRYLDRTNVKKIKDLKVSEQTVIIGKVIRFNLKKNFRRKIVKDKKKPRLLNRGFNYSIKLY